jgi:hypothetical protein
MNLVLSVASFLFLACSMILGEPIRKPRHGYAGGRGNGSRPAEEAEAETEAETEEEEEDDEEEDEEDEEKEESEYFVFYLFFSTIQNTRMYSCACACIRIRSVQMHAHTYFYLIHRCIWGVLYDIRIERERERFSSVPSRPSIWSHPKYVFLWFRTRDGINTSCALLILLCTAICLGSGLFRCLLSFSCRSEAAFLSIDFAAERRRSAPSSTSVIDIPVFCMYQAFRTARDAMPMRISYVCINVYFCHPTISPVYAPSLCRNPKFSYSSALTGGRHATVLFLLDNNAPFFLSTILQCRW